MQEQKLQEQREQEQRLQESRGFIGSEDKQSLWRESGEYNTLLKLVLFAGYPWKKIVFFAGCLFKKEPIRILQL